MTAREHLAVAGPLGLGLGLALGSFWAGLLGAAASVLVDADHLADYFVSTGRLDRLDRVLEAYYSHRVAFFVVPGHSFELWALAALLLPGWLPPALAWGLLGGWLAHLLLDQAFNACRPWAYLLTARLAVGCQRERIYTPWRNLYTDLARKRGWPRPSWTRPRAKARASRG